MKVIVATIQEIEKLIEDKIQMIVPTIIDQLSKSSQEEPQWLTVKQKAKQLNISVSMIYKLLAQEKLETKKIGRKRLIKA